MYHSEMVSLRLSTTVLAALDQKRGPTPRGRYIRHLIEKDVSGATTAQRSSPSPRTPRRPPERIPTPTTAEPSAISGKPDPSPVVTDHTCRWVGKLGNRRCSTCGRPA